MCVCTIINYNDNDCSFRLHYNILLKKHLGVIFKFNEIGSMVLKSTDMCREGEPCVRGVSSVDQWP